MKFAISKNYLLNALNTVSRAVSSKNPRAILTGIKFELNHLGLFLTGSDSDISIVTKVPMQDNNNNVITSFEPGVVVVSSRFITDIIRKLEGSIINFETLEENTLKIIRFNGKYATKESNEKIQAGYPSEWTDEEIKRDMAVKLLTWSGLKLKTVLDY